MSTILDLPEIRERAFRWSVAEYEKLGNDPAFRRTELIRGVVVNKMSKSPLHSTITTRLYMFFLRMVRPEFVARQEQPLRLQDSMPEPDVSVVRGTLEDFAARHPPTAAIVVEVTVSSLAPDRENSLLYAEAGVTEYWIVLAESAQIEMYRQPVAGIFQEKRVYGRHDVIAGVEVIGGDFAVQALFP